MKSLTHRQNKLREILILTFLGVLMYVSQVLMASLPNIELVSFLIIITARKFGIKSLASTYIFVFLEIITYGLELWVVCYLYVWAILVLCVCLVRKIDSWILYTLISGIFGFLFGTLCSLPYFLTGGFAFGISWILSGITFDLFHGFGNLILTFLIYQPVAMATDKLL